MFLFLLFSVLLVCPFFRLKELFQEKNGLTMSLLFFLENAKNLGRSDDAKWRKKRVYSLSQPDSVKISFIRTPYEFLV